MQVLQDTPGAKINASDVLELPGLGGTAASTMEILAAADLLIDDRTTAVHRYFTEHAAGLPPQMRDQLCTWFEVMLGGSKNAPRRLPRHPQTAHLHILGMAPIWHMWANRGVQSLAEISREDVAAALPPSGANRCFAEQGLRGLFDILKARKQVFTNPARGLPATHSGSTIPLPLDTELIRAALNSDDPASALAVAPVAFHGLTGTQLQELALTDMRDGRLTIDDRTIPSPAPYAPAWRHTSTTGAGPGRPPSTRTCSSTGAPAPARTESAGASRGSNSASNPKPSAKTASSRKSTPPAATYDASAISSGSPSQAPCATPPDWMPPT